MNNLIKSDLLKLLFSKSWIYPVVLTILMFIIYFIDGDAQFVSSGNIILGQGIGFISSISNVDIMNITRSSMSYSIFLILIIFTFTISFYTSEYSQNTIKLSIARGEKRFNIYLSKIFIITIFSLIIYYMLSYIIFIYNSIRFGFNPSIEEVAFSFRIVTLNFLAIEVLILLSVFISMILRTKMISNIIIFLFLFIGMMMYMNVWSIMDKQSFLMRLFLKINPIYYISTISACNFNNNIIRESLFYFILGSLVILGLSYIFIMKEEFK